VDELTVAGLWWLPNSPERKVAGHLYFNRTEGARLSLIGSFRDWEDEGVEVAPGHFEFDVESLNAAGRYPRIHGRDAKTAWTLEDCFRIKINRNLFGGGPASEEIRCNAVFRGVWYDLDEEVVADRLSAQVLHLVHWVRSSGLSERHRQPVSEGEDESDPIWSIGISHLPTVSINLPDGVEVALVHRIGLDGDLVRWSLTQDFQLDVMAPERRSYQELLAILTDAKTLISIGLNRTACLEGLTLYDPEYTVGEGKRQRAHPIEVFAQWSDRDGWREPKMLVDEETLFSLPDLEGAEAFQRLMTVAGTYRSELRRVEATRVGRSMYSSDRLLNRAAGLESFDRRRTGSRQSKLKGRVRRCCQLAGPPFADLVGDVDDWAEALRKRRDLHAHHFERPAEEDGFVDLVMADAAYFLFVLCLLREAQVPDRVFDVVCKNREYDWIKSRLPAVLASA
jgi:hypothetical protein